MQDQLYNDQIIMRAKQLVKVMRLEKPDHTVVMDSPLCGSRVKVDLCYNVDDDVITAYGHEVRACALGESSAAIVASNILGANADEITDARKNLETLLKKGEETLSANWGKWEELQILLPAHKHKSRHASILLTLKAVEKAILEIRTSSI